jgi:hypothetical protein
MMRPQFENLDRARTSGDGGPKYYGRFIHPNPEFWKYYFYVFTPDAEVEGDAFFCDANRLCIHQYQRRAAELKSSGKVGLVYNERLPRRGPETPSDEDHERWSDAEWAPPLDKDLDPPVERGHR